MNLGSPKEVVKLNEQAAIDLGSELIGDLFIFSVGAVAVVAEYTRQSKKSAEEKNALESRLRRIEDQTSDFSLVSNSLETRLAQIESSLSDLRELVAAKRKK